MQTPITHFLRPVHCVVQLLQWLSSLVTSVQTVPQIWLGAAHVDPVSMPASGPTGPSPESSPRASGRTSADASADAPSAGDVSLVARASDGASVPLGASCAVTSADDVRASLPLEASTTSPSRIVMSSLPTRALHPA